MVFKIVIVVIGCEKKTKQRLYAKQNNKQCFYGQCRINETALHNN